MDLFLRSDRLAREGFVHGFSTRTGGVSGGPFASLNLGPTAGDDPAAVEENHRLLAAAAGFPRADLRLVHQVHGDRVLRLGGWEPPPAGAEADAILATAPGIAPAVRTADCVPILLAHPRTGRVAAVHAGWRGARLGIARKTVREMAAAGTPAGELVASIGPAIGRCCYEVSADLAEDFVASYGSRVADGRRLDLREVVRLQLTGAGIPAPAVDLVGSCTACHPEAWFSHRRDRGRTGRHLSFIRAA
ncbi:MAG TPA: peptidoglycan editing factor PgeF [Vulgatibacter sp.]|nr:peptidoglycan editing factor PgeF [Vulgatibacter sp.]